MRNPLRASDPTGSNPRLAGCPVCGLVQQLPELGPRESAACTRCGKSLKHKRGRNRWTAPLSLAGLILYLPAILLPMLRIEQLGHAKEDSLLSGVVHLLAEGYWFVGLIVLAFSIVLPPLKLLTLLLLSSTSWVTNHHRKARLFHAVEFLGKWGMLDVMLVAVLVAWVKLGDLVSIEAGIGVVAFAIMVIVSLVAGLSFHPQNMWDPDGDGIPGIANTNEAEGAIL